MPDDKTKVGPRDATRVNIHEPYELLYWANRFGVTQQEVRNAVARVGVMAGDVKKALGK